MNNLSKANETKHDISPKLGLQWLRGLVPGSPGAGTHRDEVEET